MHGKVTFSCILRTGIITSGYGIEPQSHRAHKGRTNGDDYYSDANMLFLSSADIKVNFTSLRTLRLCG